jgi:hypothetical protein
VIPGQKSTSKKVHSSIDSRLWTDDGQLKGWRRGQSYANPAPVKFPANRENYREFAIFWAAIVAVMTDNTSENNRCEEMLARKGKLEQGTNREVSGNSAPWFPR